MTDRGRQAVKRRRVFLISSALIIGIILGTISFGVSRLFTPKSDNNEKKETKSSSVSKTVKKIKKDESKSEETSSKQVTTPKTNGNKLNEKYSNLMLVNAKNPLPDNYDSEIRKDLVEIEPELRNNNYVTKIHKSVYPYITAMVRAAQADGVDLKVWSPFRSYADQKALFDKQVERYGGDEDKAATIVARPGTSEHNSGICADFNMADDAFEQTEMFKWLCEHAEEYGFILRYPKDKQDKTGVIYESWHWRFVGIEAAKKINKSGLCLEEYLKKNNIKQEVSVDNF